MVWYPAYEGVGEGIFITSEYNPLEYLDLDKNLIENWEEVFGHIDAGDRDEIKVPLFVWWHTLSHALINSLSLSCGYNSTSLLLLLLLAVLSSWQDSGSQTRDQTRRPQH